MADMMTFPATFDEFAEQYKIVDNEEIYTNGSELIPIFRVKQWLEHEDPVQKWRRKTKRCYFCNHLRRIENPLGFDTFVCKAKGKRTNIDSRKPFCKLFELNKKID